MRPRKQKQVRALRPSGQHASGVTLNHDAPGMAPKGPDIVPLLWKQGLYGPLSVTNLIPRIVVSFCNQGMHVLGPASISWYNSWRMILLSTRKVHGVVHGDASFKWSSAWGAKWRSS